MTLGKHLSNADSKYAELTKKAEKINDKVEQITGANISLESNEKNLLGQ